jgi:sulfur-oxidizing protein SoxY
MVEVDRRTFVKAVAGTATLAVAGIGALAPATASAAWPKEAFAAPKTKEMLEALYGQSAPTESAAIKFTMPEIAENGSQVPFVVETSLPKVDSITVIAEENPRPLAATATIDPRSVPFLKSRLKLAKTQKLVAVVRSDGKLYSTSLSVKVTIGGCGG